MALMGSIVKVGSLTGVSRAGGFLRDILIAHALGTGPIADAFFVAMRFPNLFRQMFAEGAFNAAFVPMFAGRLEQQGPAPAKAFAERVMSVLLFWLLLFTIAAQFAMPWLMWIIALRLWGFFRSVPYTSLRKLFPYFWIGFAVQVYSGVTLWMAKPPKYVKDWVFDTKFTLVVLGAEWGHGRRQGWLSNLHLGARDPADGGFVMLGKTFKGMTDETLAWQTEQLQRIETHREGIVVAVRPELVVEIAFDGVQRSPRYPGGVALRFARLKGYRPDKSPADADTIDTVRAILERAEG